MVDREIPGGRVCTLEHAANHVIYTWTRRVVHDGLLCLGNVLYVVESRGK